MPKLCCSTHVLAFAGIALAFVSHAEAQGVFKCTVAGTTVYQAAPCQGQGKEVGIARGPSEQQVQEAKKRADAERAKMSTYRAAALERAQQTPIVAEKADCVGLNRQRSEAFGRRNGAIRTSRASNIDNSAAVGRDESDIRAIESQMVRSGCRPE